jgi:hypothetical protein
MTQGPRSGLVRVLDDAAPFDLDEITIAYNERAVEKAESQDWRLRK